MFTYVLRRLVQAFFVLMIVMLVTFTLPYFQPGGIVTAPSCNGVP